MAARAGGVAQVGRFGAVGLLATLMHATVLALCLWAGLSPVVGNLIAFFGAVGISYWGQRLWVFGHRPVRLWKFWAVALLGAGLHAVGMPVLLALGAGVWPAWWVLTVTVPVVGFLASRFWAFRVSVPL